MAMTKTQVKNTLRTVYVDQIKAFFESAGEDVHYTKDNTLIFPVVDADGDEQFIKIVVSIPIGERLGGGKVEPYDGYAEAQDYEMKKAEKVEKAKAAAEAKAKKMARDAELRAKKAAAKESREA